MRHVTNVAGRELRGLFVSPVAYGVLSLFAVLAGFFFILTTAGFQQVLVTKRLLELPAARDERSRDLTSMCDAMPQGLVLVDGNLHITYANGAAALYLGSLQTCVDRFVDALELRLTGSAGLQLLSDRYGPDRFRGLRHVAGLHL